MTFGPRPTIRCELIPVVVATLIDPDEHGRHGSMSLCGEHLDALKVKMPRACTFEWLLRATGSRKAKS